MIAAREYHLVINARETTAPRSRNRALRRVRSTHRQCPRGEKLLTQLQKAWKSPLGDPPGDNSPQMLTWAMVEAGSLWKHPTDSSAPIAHRTPEEMLCREQLQRAASKGLAEARGGGREFYLKNK